MISSNTFLDDLLRSIRFVLHRLSEQGQLTVPCRSLLKDEEKIGLVLSNRFFQAIESQMENL